MVAMSFVHGSGPVCLFGSSIYNFMCGLNPHDLTVGIDEVSDPTVRNTLHEVLYEVQIILQ